MITRISLVLCIFLTISLSACSPDNEVSPTASPYPSEVDWETAIEILNTGQVEMVAQLHSLDVTLRMKDGSEIHTAEPIIDAIFQEVSKCGEPCREIILVTE